MSLTFGGDKPAPVKAAKTSEPRAPRSETPKTAEKKGTGKTVKK